MIYLWGHAGSGNHGCEAIVRATVKMLESPAVLATTAPEEDRRYGVEEAVTLLPDTPRQLGAVERLRHAVHFKLRHDDAVYIGPSGRYLSLHRRGQLLLWRHGHPRHLPAGTPTAGRENGPVGLLGRTFPAPGPGHSGGYEGI